MPHGYICASWYIGIICLLCRHCVWWTMAPASVIVGLCAAPVWTAHYSYFTKQACRYAELSGESVTVVIARFFGILCFFYKLGKTCENRKYQSLRGAVVVTHCRKEAELKFSMEIDHHTSSTEQAGKIRLPLFFCEWDLVEISMWNSTSASFWQRVAPTAPFNTWDKHSLKS